jgi:hypothetical protein
MANVDIKLSSTNTTEAMGSRGLGAIALLDATGVLPNV